MACSGSQSWQESSYERQRGDTHGSRDIQFQHSQIPQDGGHQFAARDRAAVANALTSGAIKGDEASPAKVTLVVAGIGIDVSFEAKSGFSDTG
jgi:hypothetical protein